jgi:hypothetical protein
MDDFIYENSCAMSADDCKTLINLFQSYKELQVPGMSGNYQINTSIKKSTDIALTPEFLDDKEWSDSIKSILKALKIGLEEYKEIYSWKEKDYIAGINGLASWRVDFTYNFQKYEPGEGYYHWHCEVSNPTLPSVNRMLTWMIYLNDVPDGGTEFKFQNKIVEARQGKLIIWPPYWTHYHRGITSQTNVKYIITGWISFINGE